MSFERKRLQIYVNKNVISLLDVNKKVWAEAIMSVMVVINKQYFNKGLIVTENILFWYKLLFLFQIQ